MGCPHPSALEPSLLGLSVPAPLILNPGKMDSAKEDESFIVVKVRPDGEEVHILNPRKEAFKLKLDIRQFRYSVEVGVAPADSEPAPYSVKVLEVPAAESPEGKDAAKIRKELL